MFLSPNEIELFFELLRKEENGVAVVLPLFMTSSEAREYADAPTPAHRALILTLCHIRFAFLQSEGTSGQSVQPTPPTTGTPTTDVNQQVPQPVTVNHLPGPTMNPTSTIVNHQPTQAATGQTTNPSSVLVNQTAGPTSTSVHHQPTQPTTGTVRGYILQMNGTSMSGNHQVPQPLNRHGLNFAALTTLHSSATDLAATVLSTSSESLRSRCAASWFAKGVQRIPTVPLTWIFHLVCKYFLMMLLQFLTLNGLSSSSSSHSVTTIQNIRGLFCQDAMYVSSTIPFSDRVNRLLRHRIMWAWFQ